MERIVMRIRQLLGFGLSCDEIHDLVVSEGCDEGTFYLCYRTAENARRDEWFALVRGIKAIDTEGK